MSTPTPPAPAGLKYSDIADIVTISSTGLIAMSATNVILSVDPKLDAALAIVAFLSSAIGRYLASKGD